tara:strand:+ start:412 stop:792 length:381 start_codon:yes stop_codon:yes gene_type:complete
MAYLFKDGRRKEDLIGLKIYSENFMIEPSALMGGSGSTGVFEHHDFIDQDGTLDFWGTKLVGFDGVDMLDEEILSALQSVGIDVDDVDRYSIYLKRCNAGFKHRSNTFSSSLVDEPIKTFKEWLNS